MENNTITKEFCEIANGKSSIRIIDINANAADARGELKKIGSIVENDFEKYLPIAFNSIITSDENNKIFGVEFSVQSDKVPANYTKVESFKVK